MSEPKDPKSLGDGPHLGAPVPPTNSPSASSSTDSTAPVLGDTSNFNETTRESTSDPLFGATPPLSSDSQRDSIGGGVGQDGVKERIEAGSKDRVRGLKVAREAALGRTHQTPIPHPPAISHLSSAPRSNSTLIPYLRRLSTILSIILGSGALISLIWSALLLPLLHASFSARRALVDQQVDRLRGILAGLREVRARGMFGAVSEHNESVGSEGDKRESNEKALALRMEKQGQDTSKAMIRELSTSSSQSTPSSSSSSSSSPSPLPPLLPDLSPLLISLRTLSSTRGNTSTTRTSLLSTIESYTSALHRQLWNPRPGSNFGRGGGGWGTGYGLETLDQSLRNEGAGKIAGSGVYKDGWEGEGLGDRRGEWDSVRKEIRGLKGLLLGRRSMGVGA